MISFLINLIHQYAEILKKTRPYMDVSFLIFQKNRLFFNIVKMFYFDDQVHLKNKKFILDLMNKRMFKTDRYLSVLNILLFSEIIKRVLNIFCRNDQEVAVFLMSNYKFSLEIPTGQGKTLIHTLYSLNHYYIFKDKFIHIMTANEYLSTRDFMYSYKVYRFFNIISSCLINNQTYENRRRYYFSNILYTSPQNIIFDFLGNLSYSKRSYSIHNHTIIIDEIDKILIDYDEYPFVLSNNIKNLDQGKQLKSINKLVNNIPPTGIYNSPKLKYHYFSDKAFFYLFYKGSIKKLINWSFIFSPLSIDFYNTLTNTLISKHHILKNIDYIVSNKKIVLIDTLSGRPAKDHFFNYNLQKTLSIKEHIDTNNVSENKSSIYLLQYILLYSSIIGLSGTLLSRKNQIKNYSNLKIKILNYPINIYSTNKRIDLSTLFSSNFLNKNVLEIVDYYIYKKQPILIYLDSIKKLKQLKQTIDNNYRANINILNAINIENENQVIKKSGTLGNITLATQVTSRGTDIKLGKHREVLQKDSLFKSKQFLNNQKPSESIINMLGGLSILILFTKESMTDLLQIRGRSGRSQSFGDSRVLIIPENIDPLYKENIFYKSLFNILTTQTRKWYYSISKEYLFNKFIEYHSFVANKKVENKSIFNSLSFLYIKTLFFYKKIEHLKLNEESTKNSVKEFIYSIIRNSLKEIIYYNTLHLNAQKKEKIEDNLKCLINIHFENINDDLLISKYTIVLDIYNLFTFLTIHKHFNHFLKHRINADHLSKNIHIYKNSLIYMNNYHFTQYFKEIQEIIFFNKYLLKDDQFSGINNLFSLFIRLEETILYYRRKHTIFLLVSLIRLNKGE